MLDIKNIAIGYNNIIVEGINYHCDFELIALIGANGSGKTTLLKTLSGLNPILKGKIHINNKDITEMSNSEKAHYLSNIFTNEPINELLNVEDILTFGRIPYLSIGGKLKKEDHYIIKYYVDSLKLTPLLNKTYQTLSDGQKQQVMLARALIQKTPILLLDEPTAHLDIVNKRNVFDALKHIKESEGKTIIVITHDIDLAIEFSDSIWLIDKKHTFHSFKTSQTSKEELFKKIF